MKKKHRRIGIPCHNRKISDLQVNAIRQSSLSLTELSSIYGLSAKYIGKIRRKEVRFREPA